MDVRLHKTVSRDTIRSGEILQFSIQLEVYYNTATNVILTDTLPEEVTFLAFASGTPAGTVAGNTINWFFATLAPGNYTFTYSVKVNDFLEDGTIVKNRASVTHNAVPTPVTAVAQAIVVGDFMVRVSVYNEAGEVVKEILMRKFSQPIDNVTVGGDSIISSLKDTVAVLFHGLVVGTWDGTNGNNNPVSNGNYVIKVDNIDNMGVVESISQWVTVNRNMMQVLVVIYNSAGEEVRHLYAVTEDSGSLVSGVQVSTDVLQPGEGPVEPGDVREAAIVLSNGTAIIWDGRNDDGHIVSNGQYYIEVRSNDGKGGEQSIVRSITVDSRGGDGVAVKAMPNQITSMHPFTIFDTDPPGSIRLKVTIYATTGEKVVTLAGLAGELEWRPTQSASGYYLAVVEKTHPDGRFLGRQTIPLLLLR